MLRTLADLRPGIEEIDAALKMGGAPTGGFLTVLSRASRGCRPSHIEPLLSRSALRGAPRRATRSGHRRPSRNRVPNAHADGRARRADQLRAIEGTLHGVRHALRLAVY